MQPHRLAHSRGALESWPLSIRIERYALLGRLREAIEIGERAIAIDRSIGQGTILPRSHAFVAVAYRMAGDSAAARRHLAQAEQMIDDFGKTEMRSFVAVGAAAAYVDFLDGRYLRALERIDALLAHTNRFEPLSFYSLHPQMLPLAAEAAARAGLADKAAALIGSIRSLLDSYTCRSRCCTTMSRFSASRMRLRSGSLW